MERGSPHLGGVFVHYRKQRGGCVIYVLRIYGDAHIHEPLNI